MSVRNLVLCYLIIKLSFSPLILVKQCGVLPADIFYWMSFRVLHEMILKEAVLELYTFKLAYVFTSVLHKWDRQRVSNWFERIYNV